MQKHGSTTNILDIIREQRGYSIKLQRKNLKSFNINSSRHASKADALSKFEGIIYS